MLIDVDDEHQFQRRLSVRRELLSPYDQIQLCRLDCPRWLHERLHRKQRPAYERLQLVKGCRRSAGSQLSHGVEQDR